MAKQENPDLTSSQGHLKTTAPFVQLILKTAGRLAEQTFHSYLQKGVHIEKGRRNRDTVMNKTPSKTNHKQEGCQKHSEARGLILHQAPQTLGTCTGRTSFWKV